MKSPFSKDRFEHIPHHIYYLPQTIISLLEESKPSYVIGSRGSGKTTLLQSLNWKERRSNRWLREALNGDSFRGQFIAEYVKLPHFKVRSLMRWLDDADDDDHGMMFGLYLDLISIELLSGALASLISELYFKPSPECEEREVGRFCAEYSHLVDWVEAKAPTTVWACNRLIKQLRNKLEHRARRRVPYQATIDEILIPEIGELSRFFAKRAACLCDSAPSDKDDSWHFKICMDEAECLSERQQKVVNTLIRVSEWPISYVISYVRIPQDISTTLHPALSHQRADRNIVPLDDLKRPEFENLCDGVGTVRVRAHLDKDDVTFSTTSVLGKLDLNVLVEELVQRSESDNAKKIKRMADDFKASSWAAARSGRASAPYIEGYIASRLALSPPEAAENDDRRKQESAEFRKKIVAAYLSICNDLNVKRVPYAFDRMVFGISDNCVRDYLSQMHHIFIEANIPLEQFLASNVRIATQQVALRNASEEKDTSIPASGVLEPMRVGRLVKGLACLTATLQQGNKKSDQHLRSSERGVFVLDPQLQNGGDDLLLFDLVQEAADAGFLRVFKQGDVIPAFRVHSSLAPKYGFSYRGAYYPVRIKRVDLLSFLDCADSAELDEASTAIAKRVTGSEPSENQLMLFPEDVRDLWKQLDEEDD